MLKLGDSLLPKYIKQQWCTTNAMQIFTPRPARVKIDNFPSFSSLGQSSFLVVLGSSSIYLHEVVSIWGITSVYLVVGIMVLVTCVFKIQKL
jgi:hypothetical protein